MKKTGRGVKAITLDKSDRIEYVTVVDPEQQDFEYKGKLISGKKIKLRARASKGQKVSLT